MNNKVIKKIGIILLFAFFLILTGCLKSNNGNIQVEILNNEDEMKQCNTSLAKGDVEILNKVLNKDYVLNIWCSLTRLNIIEEETMLIPEEIGKLTNLIRLDIINNQITTLPKEIGDLTNLSVLYISDSQITTLPKELGKLTNLTELYLTNNQLINLPKEIGKLTNLSILWLNNNKLTILPKEIKNLFNLTELDLGNNSGLTPLDNTYDAYSKNDITNGNIRIRYNESIDKIEISDAE